jgi:hypothetical protein
VTIRAFRRSVPANLTTSIRPAILAAAAVVACSATGAMADIVGFQSGSFTYNQSDAGNPAQLIGNTGIQITTGSSGQFRSLWFNQRQNVSQFAAQFTFRVTGNNDTFNRDGITFVIQNAPSGTATLPGAAFGYNFNGGNPQITPSVGITTEVVLRGTGDPSDIFSYSGVYFNGQVGGGSAATLPVNAASGNSIRVNLNYDGSLLTINYTDLTTGATWSPNPTLIGSISNRLGSADAYIGFTAGVLGANRANLFINDFSYTVPTPSAAALLGLGGLMAARRRR